MRLALGFAIVTKHLFKNFNINKISIKQEQVKKLFGFNRKRKLIVNLFINFLNLVIEDCINNNVTFNMPVTGKASSFIHVKSYRGDHFLKCRRKGMFKEIDFIKSNFTANRLEIVLKSPYYEKHFDIFIDAKHKDVITENTHKGFLYC